MKLINRTCGEQKQSYKSMSVSNTNSNSAMFLIRNEKH